MQTPGQYRDQMKAAGLSEKAADILVNGYTACFNHVSEIYTEGYHDGRADMKQHLSELLKNVSI